MKTYRVKVEYIYSDTIDIEADSKEQAEKEALNECEEQCDRLHDIITTELIK